MAGPWGPDPALVSSSAHVFVESLDHPVLSEDDAHHLGRVLRLRDGEPVSITDGAGRWRLCSFRKADTSLLVSGDILVPKRVSRTFAVAVSVPKGDRIEAVTQKLTELGVATIVLCHSDHSVVRWDPAHAARQMTRLRAIALAAAKQSRRLSIPSIEMVGSLDLLLEWGDVAVAMVDGAPMRPGATHSVVAVGPEGGWSSRERDIVVSRGCAIVGLGQTVLRTDTAAIAAGVLLAALPD